MKKVCQHCGKRLKARDIIRCRSCGQLIVDTSLPDALSLDINIINKLVEEGLIDKGTLSRNYLKTLYDSNEIDLSVIQDLANADLIDKSLFYDLAGITETENIKISDHDKKSFCINCGGTQKTYYCHFYENMSYFFRRSEREFVGQLCFKCMNEIYFKYTGRTILLTWFGMIGLLLGPFYIINNTFFYLINFIRFNFSK